MGCGCNNGCGGTSWVIILIIILLLCGGFGNYASNNNDCGCGCWLIFDQGALGFPGAFFFA